MVERSQLIRLQDRLVREVRPSLPRVARRGFFPVADRMRECREPATGARFRAPARDCDPRGLRRESGTRLAATVDRKSPAFVPGGSVGLVLSIWLADLLVALGPTDLPQFVHSGIDLRALIVALALSVATGLLFGTAPASHAAKLELNEALNEGGRSGDDVGRSRTRNFLLVGEVAFSFALLIGAGLLIKSFQHLRDVRPGFNAANVLTMSISLPYAKYREDAQRTAFFDQLLERVEDPAGRAFGCSRPQSSAEWQRLSDRPRLRAGRTSAWVGRIQRRHVLRSHARLFPCAPNLADPRKGFHA